MRLEKLGVSVCLVSCILLADGCTETAKAEYNGTQSSDIVGPEDPDARWNTLIYRLKEDCMADDFVLRHLIRHGAPSPDPMGRKISSLYKKAFYPQKKPSTVTQDTVWPGYVSQKNVRLCRTMIQRYADSFAQAEKRYGVPSSIAAALLFVETGFGPYLGAVPALYTLASMASARDISAISDFMAKLEGSAQRRSWIEKRMRIKSDWAYRELTALILYLRANGMDPDLVPGSIYGAIGYCQFMPSNIEKYAEDGNGDGVVDLFQMPDAVASLSRYLAMHGWKANLSKREKHRVLFAYNHSNAYAGTILALAEAIERNG